MKLIQNSKLEAVRQRVAGTVPPQTPAVPCDRAADVLGCAHGLRANTCGGLGKRRQAPSSLSLRRNNSEAPPGPRQMEVKTKQTKSQQVLR